MKTTAINVLIVEDSLDDVDLTVRELRHAGFDPKWKRVETEAEFLAELTKSPDIILSDYTMPQFSGLRAAKLLQESGREIPFILVSGTVGEGIAVEAMKHGATDYLLKDRIARLGFSVKRALEEKRQRDEGKRANAAMNASEARYRRLFEAAKDGILILNAATGRIVDVNPFLTEMLGYTREFFIGKHLWELGLFKDIAANEDHFKELQAKDYIHYDDLALETSDGRRIEVEFVSNVYLVDGYRVIQCNIRDITERKRAELALHEKTAALTLANVRLSSSEQKLRCLYELSPLGIALTDMQGRYLEFNEAFRVICDYPAEELKQLDYWKLTPETYEQDEARQLEALRQTGYYGPYEKHYRRSDGTLIPVNLNGMLITDSAGQNMIWSIVEDITERKRAEELMRLLKSAVLQAKDSILITDAEVDLPGPRIVFINPAFTTMTGYTAEEVIGKTPRILQGPKTDKALLKRLRQNLERGEVFAGEAINYRKDGTEFNLHWHIAPIRNATGIITHFVAIQRDITEHKKLEAQFRQAQKMESIGTLAGGVAHDFNNILAVIQMQAGLLNIDGDLSAAQSELADDIGIAIQRAVALTRQLLMFSRKEVLQPRALDLNCSVSEMTKMLTRLLGENIAVQLKLAAQPMFLHADAAMIDQVLMNLCVNARDAMPDGGRLVIETAGVEFDEFAVTQTAQARPGSFVCLSVSDRGCGIPPENLSKIFEPFFTTKGVGKGTGLGLATVFGIAQQHLGWVNVYSEVGQGTTFKVYLPRLAESHDTKIIKKLPASAPTGQETILLVEDEPSLRMIIKLSLSRLGYRVLEAAAGKKALAVWKEHPGEIHLLLTDLMMPDDMTGKELGQRLLQENPKLKVIYMSGYSPEIVVKDFPLQEGVNFLAKPFLMQKLAQAIRQSLD